MEIKWSGVWGNKETAAMSRGRKWRVISTATSTRTRAQTCKLERKEMYHDEGWRGRQGYTPPRSNVAKDDCIWGKACPHNLAERVVNSHYLPIWLKLY